MVRKAPMTTARQALLIPPVQKVLMSSNTNTTATDNKRTIFRSIIFVESLINSTLTIKEPRGNSLYTSENISTDGPIRPGEARGD